MKIEIYTNKNDVDILVISSSTSYRYTYIDYSKEVFLEEYSEINQENINKFVDSIIKDIAEFIKQNIEDSFKEQLKSKILKHINNYE